MMEEDEVGGWEREALYLLLDEALLIQSKYRQNYTSRLIIDYKYLFLISSPTDGDGK
jgi:hypothetical protein